MNAIAQASVSRVTGPKLDNRRVLAGVVDLLVVVAGALVILYAADALSGDRSEVRGALSAVITGWALYYYFAVESGSGQTLGKKLMKLRVVRVDGRPAGMREIAVRTVLRVVDGVGLYIVGLIVMLVTGEKRQRLGDLAAGTIVVDASAPPAPAATAPVATPPVAEAPVAEAPVAEAPVAEAPVAEAPVVEDVEVEEPYREEPLPEVSSPSLEELAEDVEAARTEPVEVVPVEAEPVEVEPVEAEPVEVEPVAAEPVEPGDEPEVTVRSVETVSAIDLVMGGQRDEETSSDSGSDPVR